MIHRYNGVLFNIKNDEVMQFVATRMDMENIILSVKSEGKGRYRKWGIENIVEK